MEPYSESIFNAWKKKEKKDIQKDKTFAVNSNFFYKSLFSWFESSQQTLVNLVMQ